MELDHVEAFLAIARSGGFARGSAALHLSQPATSRRIKLLEAELGAPLFDRLGRGVALTEAGRAFLPHAQALPASVRVTPRPSRSNSGAPSSASSSLMRRLVAGWDRCKVADPRAKPPLRAIARNAST